MADIDLTISSLGGTFCALKASRSWNVRNVKEQVSEPAGLPTDEVRLLGGDQEPAESTLLEALFAEDAAVAALMLVRRTSVEVEFLNNSGQARWAGTN